MELFRRQSRLKATVTTVGVTLEGLFAMFLLERAEVDARFRLQLEADRVVLAEELVEDLGG